MNYRILKIFLHIELISREFVKFNRSTDMFEILFHSGISKNLNPMKVKSQDTNMKGKSHENKGLCTSLIGFSSYSWWQVIGNTL